MNRHLSQVRRMFPLKLNQLLLSLNVLQFCFIYFLISSSFSTHHSNYQLERQQYALQKSMERSRGSSNRHALVAQQVSHFHPPQHETYASTSYTLYKRPPQGWTPQLEDIYNTFKHDHFMSRMEELMGPQASLDLEPLSQPPKRMEFLAFLRIPKTGSTSVLGFLQDTPNLYTEDVFMNRAKFIDSNVVNDFRNELGCVFGHYNPQAPHAHQIVPHPESLNTYQKRHWVCPHLNLGGTMKDLVEALQYLENPQHDNLDVVIHPFTMVRDPFDRLVSFFYYVYDRRKHGFWKDSFTERQYRHVMDNDLTGWLESLHSMSEQEDVVVVDTNDHDKNGTTTTQQQQQHQSKMKKKKPQSIMSKQMLNQQQYISQDWEIATELIHNGRVLMLVMECFSVSIQLLVEVFPHMFHDKERLVHDFLKAQDKMHQNQRHSAHAPAANEPNQDENDDEEEEEEEEENDDDDNPVNHKNEDDDNPAGNEEDEHTDDETEGDRAAPEEQRRRRRLSEQEKINLEEYRAKFLEWFPHHYEFYRLAVLQFRADVEVALALPGTMLQQDQVDKCFETLDQKSSMLHWEH